MWYSGRVPAVRAENQMFELPYVHFFALCYIPEFSFIPELKRPPLIIQCEIRLIRIPFIRVISAIRDSQQIGTVLCYNGFSFQRIGSQFTLYLSVFKVVLIYRVACLNAAEFNPEIA